jgi:two-component system, chemotaxis family, sensor kinase CheA
LSNTSDERGAELRALFFESAQELLQALNDEALQLEKKPGDAELVRGIRRTVHTLKGDAAACGYRELSELAHELEDVLAMEIKAASHHEVAEVALLAADVFGAILQAHRNNQAAPQGTALRERIQQLAQQPLQNTRRPRAASTSVSASWTEYEQVAIRAALDQGRRVYQVSVWIDPQCAMPMAARQLVHNALQSAGEVLALRPEAGAASSSQTVEAAIASAMTAQELESKCRIPSIVAKAKVEVLRGRRRKKAASSPAQPPEASPPAQPETGTASESRAAGAQAEAEAVTTAVPSGASASVENILRVDAERIDNVLNLVGELIIGKSMLAQTLNEFGRRFPKDALRNKFADAMSFQSRVLNDLQRAVMKVRMVPVEQLFRRFPRVVRDVARQCGKDVELVLTGQDTDLDKSILDSLAEPLTHMVRNAVSHGIEPVAERQGRGKPAKGTITLDAYHQGNQVIVEVRDDGRGIDAARVRAKAVALNLATAAEAERLSDAEALQFIFRPSFSTAEEVTEISGRGVGMDVVQSVLHRLKGSVGVETRPGEGTSFRLRLPLTLAIIKALMFRVEQRLYAIPLNAVAEIARATEAEVHLVDNHEVLQLRQQVLPLIRLGRLPEAAADRAAQKFFLLVIQVGEKKYGLIVDGLVGEEELVIKALDDQVVATDLVSGASILGDGRVVLILNLAAIIERVSRLRPEGAGSVLAGLLFSQPNPVAPQPRHATEAQA